MTPPIIWFKARCYWTYTCYNKKTEWQWIRLSYFSSLFESGDFFMSHPIYRIQLISAASVWTGLFTPSGCRWRWKCNEYAGWSKILAHFCAINRLSKLFHFQNQKKICNNTINKDPATLHVCCYTTLWNVTEWGHTVALFHWSRNWSVVSPAWCPATRRTHWCKNCRMWQLL